MIAYLITNLVNGRKYVGITTRSLRRRWSCHRADAASGKQTILARAIRKYGHVNFAVDVLFSGGTPEGLKLIERLLIVQHNSRSPFGYNMTEGGDGTKGLTHSLESRIKIGIGARRPMPDEQKRKIGDGNRGRKLSFEHCIKLSEQKMGKKLAPRTQAHRDKIAAGLRLAAHRRKERNAK
jgi:group I intron endonuclease